jgi:DNA-binding NtrC family response regulator
MKILYVNPVGPSGPVTALLGRGGHEVTSVAKPEDALEMIGTEHFSAVLIAEEIQNAEAFDFISRVHRQLPELLVFQLSVWRSELAEALELLETIEKAGDAPLQ